MFPFKAHYMHHLGSGRFAESKDIATVDTHSFSGKVEPCAAEASNSS